MVVAVLAPELIEHVTVVEPLKVANPDCRVSVHVEALAMGLPHVLLV